MGILEFIIDLLLGGPRFWVGVALGLAAALAAWMFLPETADRGSISALIFFGGIVLAVVWGSSGDTRK